MQELSTLDTAISDHSMRVLWLHMLKADGSHVANNWLHSQLSISWFIMRSIYITEFVVNPKHFSAVTDGLRDALHDCLMNRSELWTCKGLKHLQLSRLCRCSTADISVSALGQGCGQLKSISLSNCYHLSDVGVSALGQGCGQLRSINLSYCNHITDVGVSALGKGCSQLQSINLSCCSHITDIGVSALGHGCGQLRWINLSRCCHITDISVSALGHGCGQLQSINLSYCNHITDIGVSALGHGCGQL